jgi:hypothetical protein
VSGADPASDDLRRQMIAGWVETAARLLRADHPRELVFETMALVALTGVLKARRGFEAAAFLRQIAEAVEEDRDPGHMLRDLSNVLRDHAP